MAKKTVADRINALFGPASSGQDIINSDILTAAAVAARQLEEAETSKWFIPNIPKSKATPAQQEFIDSFSKYEYRNYFCRGGNQCFSSTTLVATPDGPRKISELRVGDFVLDPDNKPIRVMAVHANGEQEVFDYTNRGRIMATCTAAHKFLTYRWNPKKALDRASLGIREVGKAAVVLHTHALLQTGAPTMGPNKAWVYGALQGDGCCTCGSRKRLIISSADNQIPDKLAHTLCSTAHKCHEGNYNWAIPFDGASLPLYAEHFMDKKAHEKHLPTEVIHGFSTEEALGYLAGLLDTDGGIAFDTKAKAGYMCWSTQNAVAVEHIQFLIAKFFRMPTFVYIDDRPKYKNGCMYGVKVTNPHDLTILCEALAPYCVLARKVNASVFASAGSKSHPDCVTLLQDAPSKRTEHVFNITVDHPENLYQLANGLISKNSGKSLTCDYLIGHLLNETLPNWKRLERWYKEPLLIIHLCRQGKQIEASLWTKLKPYLKPGTYKETRQGGQLQYVEMDNGNKLIYISYQNTSDARDAVQSFTAHYIFIDELPSKASIIEEAQNRVLVNEGIFVAAFTPKRPSPEVKRLVEGADKRFNKGFRLRMEDNPGISEDSKVQQRAKAAQYGGKLEAAILEGDWVDGDNAVFYLSEQHVVRELPDHYNKHTWTHWESSDPANVSGFGLVVIAQDPTTHWWYVVKSKTLSGPDIECPSVSVNSVKRETFPYKIEKRICDPAAAAYRGEARKMGLKYGVTLNKYLAFDDTIDKVQEAIGRTVFLTPEAQELLDEMYNYQRSEDNPEHIIHRKKFHLVDAFRYLVSVLPKPDRPIAEEVEPPYTQAAAITAMRDFYEGKAKKKPAKFRDKLRRVNSMHWGR